VLEIVAGPAVGQCLEPTTSLVIGRQETGFGALGGDPEISRRHAQLSPLGDGRLLVEDLGSTNGTWVNGSRIPAPTLVTSGDEVALGGTVLRVRAAEAAELPQAPPPVALPPKEKRPGLRVEAGWARGAQIRLPDGPLVLGRTAAGSEEFGGDPNIAPEHVRVTPVGSGRVLVEDLGSGLGTTVNGAAIPAPAVLSPGDRFTIGGQTLEVIELAGSVPTDAELSAIGAVWALPAGLYERISARAPVTGQEVMRTYGIALGWAIAANLLIRAIAVDVADVPHDLEAIKPLSLLLATVGPPTFNSMGFAKIFRRPDNMSVRRYLIPTFGVPLLAVGLNLALQNYSGFAETLTTLAVTVVPVMITAPLMLRLRDRVAAERLRKVLQS
jgi:pSer/pThr/pTyr-binding forkhead associated (FHA) protein